MNYNQNKCIFQYPITHYRYMYKYTSCSISNFCARLHYYSNDSFLFCFFKSTYKCVFSLKNIPIMVHCSCNGITTVTISVLI